VEKEDEESAVLACIYSHGGYVIFYNVVGVRRRIANRRNNRPISLAGQSRPPCRLSRGVCRTCTLADTHRYVA
jgi:hypothetical protein